MTDTSFQSLGRVQAGQRSASGYSRDQIDRLKREQALGMRMGAGMPTATPFITARDRNNTALQLARIDGLPTESLEAKAPSLTRMAALEMRGGLDFPNADQMMPAPLDTVTTGGRMAPQDTVSNEAPAWDPFANPDMKGMTGMEKRRARQARGFADGGTLIGPGGPTDDMIPGVVDGTLPVRLSSGERIQKASTRDWLGEKFFVDLDKKADRERAEYEAEKLRPQSRPRPKSMPLLDAETSMPIPGFAVGGTVDRIGEAATRARIREQDALLSPDPYGPTLNDSPAFQPMPMRAPLPGSAASSTQPEPQFQPDPGVLAALRERRRDLRGMPELSQGQQPAVNAASPMEPPPMRRAPMTMTEKDRLNMPLRPSVTPQVDPDFEATLVGQSGMAKRRARAAYLQEQALWKRDDQRQQVKQTEADTRAQRNRAQDFEEWKQKRVIDSQFDMAARNQAMGANAAMQAATTAEARAYEAQQNQQQREEQAKRAKNFTPIPDTDYLINDLGNLVSKKSGKPVGLSPEQAKKYGLEIIGADSDGRVRYGPVKPVENNQRFMDPETGKTVELKPGEVLPAGSFFQPLQPATTPATQASASMPTERHKALLRANPDQAAAYDAKFGPGSAARDLQ